MKLIADGLKSLVTFDVKNDDIIQNFIKVAEGSETETLTAYSNICRILLCKNVSLAQYVHDMMIFSESPLIQSYIKSGNEIQKKAIEFDVETLKSLAGTTAAQIKKYLSDRLTCDIPKKLPEFEVGEFAYDADYFIEQVKQNGSGMFAKYKAFTYQSGQLKPVASPDTIRLSDLKKYEVQRKQILDNTLCFVNGQPANNVLLYGDRGTGKSSTIKAMLNEFDGLRIVQLDKSEIPSLFELYDILGKSPLSFIIFIDDLVFNEDDDSFGFLKQALDGSLAVRPRNVAIYATTNRRHLIKETNASRDADAVHRSDAVDDNMSLADRFGLFVTFTAPTKETYLEIVSQIVKDKGLEIDEEQLRQGAERFSLKRGGRSPRIARQYVEMLEGRLNSGLDLF